MADFSIAPFVSGFFWVFLGLFAVGYWLLNAVRAGKISRNLYMIIISLSVICCAQTNGSRLFFIIFILSVTSIVYLTGRALLRESFLQKKILLISVVGLIVFLLCYFKYAVFQNSINNLLFYLFTQMRISVSGIQNHLFVIGVSYFSFKYIHFLVECHNKKLTGLSFLTFLNYILFFPGFFIGPINRYNTFSSSIEKTPDNNDIDIINGIKRIITGLFKKVVLSGFFFPYSLMALDLGNPEQSRWMAFIAIYAYGLYVYFDFSGYSDMAIGSAKLVGINLPENFNNPFLKTNIQQFWANWHMSLTSWLTDYIYWPVVKKLRNYKSLRKKTVTLSCIGITITFMVCGIWHGDGVHYLYWGIMHGVGLSLLNIYKHLIKSYCTKDFQKWINKSKSVKIINNIITVQYVCVSFILFAFDIQQIKQYFGLLFGIG